MNRIYKIVIRRNQNVTIHCVYGPPKKHKPSFGLFVALLYVAGEYMESTTNWAKRTATYERKV